MIGVWIVLAYLKVATFRVCYLDTSTSPHEFVADPKYRTVTIVQAQLIGFADANVDIGGIDCVKIQVPGRTVYVIGTLREICQAFGIDPRNEACTREIAP